MNNTENNKINVFIVGAKSIGQYGGFESFVNKLIESHQNEKSIQYHVSCKKNGIGSMDETQLEGISILNRDSNSDTTSFKYHNAYVYKISIPRHLGSAEAIYYDIAALSFFIRYCKKNAISKPIFYILASRIGPFVKSYVKQIHKIGGTLFLNPDGHEWKRSKWSMPIKLYWKLSERLMIKNADLVICDSKKIEDYIKQKYNKYNPKTKYISYGSELRNSLLEDDNSLYKEWLNKWSIRIREYYVFVGRLVPENNFETIIREFMNSNISKDLVIITNENNQFLKYLENKLSFSKDRRIKFVGSVYNQELLTKIREDAFANIHGHEVGGTNPSLLEALSRTKISLLYDVGFNREVAEDAALYWNKEENNLKNLLEKVDNMKQIEIKEYEKKAKYRIEKYYNWELIAKHYLEAYKRYNKTYL